MKKYFAFGFVVILVLNVLPALLNRDQVRIQQACDQATQQTIQFTKDQINGLPYEMVIDQITK